MFYTLCGYQAKLFSFGEVGIYYSKRLTYDRVRYIHPTKLAEILYDKINLLKW